MERDELLALINDQGLPDGFERVVDTWYRPLAAKIAATYRGSTLVLGVQGSQGSGKSTLAQFLKLLLSSEHQLATVELSIDDFYLTLAEREKLSQDVHPLLCTRGVPGTHDVALAMSVIDSLKSQSGSECTWIPRFNKAVDDREPKGSWDKVCGKVDVIIFEGWCVGIGAQSDEELREPQNQLEREEDAEGIWREHVNGHLKGAYQQLFSLLDRLVVLKAPSFECVHRWRWLQEQKLIQKLAGLEVKASVKTLDEQSVHRFISHYERLTRHGLVSLPAQADWVLPLNEDHAITQLVSR